MSAFVCDMLLVVAESNILPAIACYKSIRALRSADPLQNYSYCFDFFAIEKSTVFI